MKTLERQLRHSNAECCNDKPYILKVVMSISSEEFNIRLDAIKDASIRARRVFIVSITISLIQIGILHNTRFSWIPKQLGSKVTFDNSKVIDFIEQQILRSWVDSIYINIPILGLKFTNSVIFGTLILLFVCIWLFYCVRRENHLIGKLFVDIKNDKVLRKLAYYGVCGTQIFATVTTNDRPINSISDAIQIDGKLHGVRFISMIMTYLPFFTVLLAIFTNFLSYCTPVPFQENFKNFFDRSWDEILNIVSVEIIVFCFEIYIFKLLVRIRAFQEGTMSLIRDANNKWISQTFALDMKKLSGYSSPIIKS